MLVTYSMLVYLIYVLEFNPKTEKYEIIRSYSKKAKGINWDVFYQIKKWISLAPNRACSRILCFKKNRIREIIVKIKF